MQTGRRCGDTSRRTARRCALAVPALAAALACSPAVHAPTGDAVPVRAAAAVQRDVPIDIAAIGNVEPIQTVSLRPEIDGRLESVHFEEGQHVEPGDVLFTIDPRPFQAALEQAQANLARDEAQARYSDAQSRRYQQLFHQGVASQQQLDQFRTGAEAQRAAVDADRAAADKAKLELSYCTIRSPIRGRTGSLSVHPGDVVKAHETLMVVINQIAPIFVRFSVPEQDLPAVQERMRSGPPEVRVEPDEAGAPEHTGTLSFVDNQVDVNTGTVRMKATFANREESLWPGEFVHVLLRVREEPNAVVVPSQAVQTGPEGAFVFVVKPDDRVEVRPVGLGPVVGEDTVIDHGVKAGEQVVTDGQLRLAPGVRVKLEQVAAGGGEPSS